MNKHDMTGYELYKKVEEEFEKDNRCFLGGLAFVFVFLMMVPYILFIGG